MLFDFIHVLRSLCRAKLFFVVVVATLAIGIGSASAIFSVCDWFLFRPDALPKDVYLIQRTYGQGEIPVQIIPRLRAFQEQSNVMTEYGEFVEEPSNVVVYGQPALTKRVSVTPNILNMIGLRISLGRGFLTGEAVAGQDNVVVITWDYWKKKFGGDPSVLGTSIEVDRQLCKIVGVIPDDAVLPVYFQGVELYKPLIVKRSSERPLEPFVFVLGRLRAGVSVEDATHALERTKMAVPPQVADYFANERLVLTSLSGLKKLYHPEIYTVLMAAVGFLYGIACLNGSNLMLNRILGRRRELSIRLALGGGRWQILRLFMLESFVLASASALGACFVASWIFRIIMVFEGELGTNTFWVHDSGDLIVLIGLSLVTCLSIVAVPAFRILRLDIHAGLKDGGATMGESRRLARLRDSLVILQAAFAIILLCGTGLMVKTFVKLQRVDLGFTPEHKAKFSLGFPTGHDDAPDVRLQSLKKVQERVRAVPGVLDVAYGTNVLLRGFQSEGQKVQFPDGNFLAVNMDIVTPNFWEAAGLRLKKGRWFSSARRGLEIVINDALAEKEFGSADPIGQYIRSTEFTKGFKGWEVVGVVNNVRETLRDAPSYKIYGPENWAPAAMDSFILRLERDANPALDQAIRKAVYDLDPQLIVGDVVSVNATRDSQAASERFALSVLRLLSGLAITLAVVGLFSILSYSVDRRMNEFGVRLALGATPRNLAKLIVRRGLALAGIGVLAGGAGAMFLARSLQTLLFETAPYDPVVLSVVAAVLMGTALVASMLPARRASLADVTKLLRTE